MVSIKKKSMNGQEKYLSGIEYPGRFIIGGQLKTVDEIFLVYGITGRSAPSQARQLVKKENGIWVEPTDPRLIVNGNPDLLIYPAIMYSPEGIAVSNGKQTADILNSLEKVREPVLALVKALKDWKYEPDQPIYTPRISLAFCGGYSLAGSVIKRGEFGAVIRNYFELPLMPGKGWLIMTYLGVNIDPVPPFSGEPISLEIAETTSEEIASCVYHSLRPPEGKNDLRVAVACVRASAAGTEIQEVKIANRHEG
jgi:IMP cyclohydrolase